MIPTRTSSTAIKGLAVALLSLCLCVGHALGGQAVGTVTHLSGPLMAKKQDGATRALGRNSTVEEGDTLVTEKRTYARITFIDSGEVTLRPGTIFKVERYAYDERAPKDDNAVMSLVKGGLRSVTGKIGHRGNQDAYEMKTPVATIGIRGTNFGALFCQSDCGSVPMPSGQAPSNGLHVDVTNGSIVLINQGGSQLFMAGQFGFTPSPTVPPVILPQNPGILFTPPPSFSSGPGQSNNAPPGAGQQGGGTTDCIVR